MKSLHPVRAIAWAKHHDQTAILEAPALRQSMTAFAIPEPIQKVVIRRLEENLATLPQRYNPNLTNSLAGKIVAPLVSFAEVIAIRVVKAKVIELIQSQYQEQKQCR